MKRCVASSSCGEIFTLISESESLNREKSWRLLSRCGTLCFFRLSATGSKEKEDTQSHCLSLEVYTDPLGPHTFRSANCGRHDQRPTSLPAGDGGQQQMVPCCFCLGSRREKLPRVSKPRVLGLVNLMIAVQTLHAATFWIVLIHTREL